MLLGVRDDLSSLGGGIEALLGMQPGVVAGGQVDTSEIGFVLLWMGGLVHLMG